MLNMLVQEEMKFKMELCEQQMEEVRGRREVEITYIKIIKSLNISMISGGDLDFKMPSEQVSNSYCLFLFH